MQQPIGECYENGYSGVCEEPVICFRKRTVMNISKVISKSFLTATFPNVHAKTWKKPKLTRCNET